MQITEEWILTHAPSPAVAEDGRALSRSGCFDKLCRASGSEIYWAECSGSAKNPYYVSIDWSLSQKEPIYGCSCPSPHFPCKHVIGLMYELLKGSEFDIGKPPPHVSKARIRAKAEHERAEARLERMRKNGAMAKEKRLDRQFDGLNKVERLVNELLTKGVVSISDLPAQTLDRLSAELGNCALTGMRDKIDRLALLERQLRADRVNARDYYAEMVLVLTEVRVMLRKSRGFLDEQRTFGSYALEEPLLYELLGGVWDVDELREVGALRKNARLIQLSFDVSYDEVRRAYVERGFWLDISQGGLVQTCNAIPAKQGRYSPSDDSCFDLMEVPVLYETPVMPCPRVWWDRAVALVPTQDERAAIFEHVQALDAALETAREQLCEPLLPSTVPVLVSVHTVGWVGEALVLEDEEGTRIELRDRSLDDPDLASASRLISLPEPPAQGDALFGLIYYDELDHRLCLHPYSLVRPDEIVRLQF